MAGEGVNVGSITAEFRKVLLDFEIRLGFQTYMNNECGLTRFIIETEHAKINSNYYSAENRPAVEAIIVSMLFHFNHLKTAAQQHCHEIRTLRHQLRLKVSQSDLGSNNRPGALMCRSFVDVRAVVVLRLIAPWLFGIKIALDGNALPHMEVFREILANDFELVIVHDY